MGFAPPDWAAPPSRRAILEVQQPDGSVNPIALDTQPFYTIGREPGTVDILVDDVGASRLHAALVHHRDGRLFLIDLKSSHGTVVDGKPVPAHKPVAMNDGSEVLFGRAPQIFIVRMAPAPGAGSRGAAAARSHTVRASHLLVKHRESRRPSSWKEPTVTRSPEEALAMIEDFRRQLVAGTAEFASLAARESHCSSASRGGDLGEFGPGQMQRAFEDATYALQVGELSGPVFSDSGVHLILRTA